MSCDPKEKPDKMVHVLVRLIIGLAQQVVLNKEQGNTHVSVIFLSRFDVKDGISHNVSSSKFSFRRWYCN